MVERNRIHEVHETQAAASGGGGLVAPPLMPAIRSADPTAPMRCAEEVTLYRTRLDTSAASIDRAKRLVSSAELDRAAAFFRSRDADRFLASRATLRSTLGRILSIDPHVLEYELGPNGKPQLSRSLASIQFSVSRSRDLMLLAVASKAAVGVDVEFRGEGVDEIEVATSEFSGREAEAIRSLGGDERRKAFYSCWVRKEAFVKATGEGLSRPLRTFEVGVDDCDRSLRDHGGDDGASRCWWIRSFALDDNYAAAIAVEGGASPLRWVDVSELEKVAL